MVSAEGFSGWKVQRVGNGTQPRQVRSHSQSQSPPTVTGHSKPSSTSPVPSDWRLAATTLKPYCGAKFLMSPPAKALPMPPKKWLEASPKKIEEEPKKVVQTPPKMVSSSPKPVQPVAISGEVARLFRCTELLMPVENTENLRKAVAQAAMVVA